MMNFSSEDTMKRFAVVISLLLLVVGVGCVEQTRELSAADRTRIRDFVSTTRPSAIQHPLVAKFEDKIELLGYDLSADVARPGQPITVTWYWHVLRPLEEGWVQFTHIATGEGENKLNQDGEGVIRQVYPPGRWKGGEYIKDTQTITIPADWGSTRAVFYLGFYKGDTRLEVVEGPRDNDNRVRALSIRTNAPGEAPPPPAPLPDLRAAQAQAAITVDGRLDEPVWVATPRSGRLVDTMNGSRAEPESYVRVAWDATNLYVAFEVNDPFLKSSFTSDDDHLWEQDAVEIMVDPDGDGRSYFEMQVAPTGKVFDTRYDTARQPQPFGHTDWQSGLHAAVAPRGTPNDTEADQGYTVEIAIPWTAFAAATPAVTAPTTGSMWRMNFFVMDARADGPMHYAAWSPPRVGDFHTLAKFGRLMFSPAAAAVPPPLPGAPTNAPPLPNAPGAVHSGALPQLRLAPGQQEALRRNLVLPGGQGAADIAGTPAAPGARRVHVGGGHLQAPPAEALPRAPAPAPAHP